MHAVLQPLIDQQPIAPGDTTYPAKLEAARQTTIQVLEASLTLIDNQVSIAAAWAYSMTVVANGKYGAAWYAADASNSAFQANQFCQAAAASAQLASSVVGLPLPNVSGAVLRVNSGANGYVLGQLASTDLADADDLALASRRAKLALYLQL